MRIQSPMGPPIWVRAGGCMEHAGAATPDSPAMLVALATDAFRTSSTRTGRRFLLGGHRVHHVPSALLAT
jgi:hypothetical protein